MKSVIKSPLQPPTARLSPSLLGLTESPPIEGSNCNRKLLSPIVLDSAYQLRARQRVEAELKTCVIHVSPYSQPHAQNTPISAASTPKIEQKQSSSAKQPVAAIDIPSASAEKVETQPPPKPTSPPCGCW